MLAILVVGTLVTVLVGTVVVGQGQTRFDQGFEQSLPAAETGLERMLYLVRSGARTDGFSLADTSVAGGHYSGAAVRVGRRWTFTATGIADGTSRTVTVTVNLESVFGLAAFGKLLVELRGSNTADSYRSGTFSQSRSFTELAGGSNVCGERMCTPTGHGVVATNAELYLLGTVIDVVDRVEIHNAKEMVPDPLPGATGFCGGVPKTCSSPKLAYLREPIDLDPDPVVPPADLTNQGSFTGAILPAGRQLFTNMTLDSTTVIQGTPENPSIVYLTGTLTVPNHAVVNFKPGGLVPKPSPGLLIFSGGVGPALRFGNHANLAGALYAPRATFAGGAGGNIFGSMITGSISTNGDWNFHYDDALGDVETEAKHVISGWAES